MKISALNIHKQYSSYCTSLGIVVKLGYVYPQPGLTQNNGLAQKGTFWSTCPRKEQNYLQNGLIRLYFSITQPPRLWGFYLTRNLGGFFVSKIKGLHREAL